MKNLGLTFLGLWIGVLRLNVGLIGGNFLREGRFKADANLRFVWLALNFVGSHLLYVGVYLRFFRLFSDGYPFLVRS